MKLRVQPPLHLTYCLNVHPGEQWADNLAAIQTHTLAIRNRIAPGKPFGLGLRLSRLAAETLQQPDTLAGFRNFMRNEGLYAFTINGFPYGAFHGKPVKTTVYHPDWSTRERLDYTLILADILAQLLPDGVDGSISTVPLGYGLGFPRHEIRASRLETFFPVHLAECAAGLHAIRAKTGREIHLGLEPEPDCLLENTDDVIRFFEGPLLEQGLPHLASRLSCTRQEAEAILRRHIGICFDTCHLAIQFEDLADSLSRLTDHGIRISKIQLSSALEVAPTQVARQRLLEFQDPVYLHQVKGIKTFPPELVPHHLSAEAHEPHHPQTVREAAAPPNSLRNGESPEGRDGGLAVRRVFERASALTSFPDLPVALASPLAPDALAQLWRIHFHLPLYFSGDGVLHSTSKAMDSRFWQKLATSPVSHLEIETYTFTVLPQALQAGGIESSIAREYDWVINLEGIPRHGSELLPDS